MDSELILRSLGPVAQSTLSLMKLLGKDFSHLLVQVKLVFSFILLKTVRNFCTAKVPHIFLAKIGIGFA